MRILFLEIETESEWAHAAMGPACLAAYLRAASHRADLLRVRPADSFDAVMTMIRQRAPDIVGFSMTTRQWPRADSLAGQIRHRLRLPTIAGGLHATFAPESTLASGSFDYLCIGEGEGALYDLMNALESGQNPRSLGITNIWHKGGPRPNLRPPLTDLDSLPFPARDLLDEMEGVAHINTMRGCPFTCTYCAAGALNNLYGSRPYTRRRSVANVIAELVAIRAAGPLHYIIFLDDTFTLNHRWVRSFCDKFGQEIGTGFSIHARAETLNPALLGTLASAGCRHIVIGVESGSQRIRETILKRPGTDQKYVEAFRWVRQAGMLATANYMLGIPGESESDIEETLTLHRRLKPDDFGYFVFYPHPGTALTKTCREKGYLPADYLDQPVAYDRTALNLPGLSRTAVEACHAAFTRERTKLYRDRNRHT